jgi:hypothetical protein
MQLLARTQRHIAHSTCLVDIEELADNKNSHRLNRIRKYES